MLWRRLGAKGCAWAKGLELVACPCREHERAACGEHVSLGSAQETAQETSIGVEASLLPGNFFILERIDCRCFRAHPAAAGILLEGEFAYCQPPWTRRCSGCRNISIVCLQSLCRSFAGMLQPSMLTSWMLCGEVAVLQQSCVAMMALNVYEGARVCPAQSMQHTPVRRTARASLLSPARSPSMLGSPASTAFLELQVGARFIVQCHVCCKPAFETVFALQAMQATFEASPETQGRSQLVSRHAVCSHELSQLCA